MNTFFFGYLSLKWRRLIRFVVCPILIFGLAVFNIESNIASEFSNIIFSTHFSNLDDITKWSIIIIMVAPQLAFISWIIKPFVVKEKS